MKLTLTNQEVISYTNFMNIVSAKGRKARATAKFMKLIKVKFDEYADDEMKIVEDYSQKDEEGNLLSTTTIHWIPEKESEGKAELSELKQDTVVIDLTEFEPFMEHLISAIEDNDTELSGDNLLLFDEILTKLEALRKEDK